jgi:hypothetical protein
MKKVIDESKDQASSVRWSWVLLGLRGPNYVAALTSSLIDIETRPAPRSTALWIPLQETHEEPAEDTVPSFLPTSSKEGDWSPRSGVCGHSSLFVRLLLFPWVRLLLLGTTLSKHAIGASFTLGDWVWAKYIKLRECWRKQAVLGQLTHARPN